MLSILLLNWKYVVIATLTAALATMTGLYKHEVNAFNSFKLSASVQAEVAKIEVAKIEAHQGKIAEEITNAWNAQLPKVRSAAVNAYIIHHPNAQFSGVCNKTSVSGLSQETTSTQSIDGTSKECIPPSSFIANCAEDALKIQQWQNWATHNELTIAE